MLALFYAITNRHVCQFSRVSFGHETVIPSVATPAGSKTPRAIWPSVMWWCVAPTAGACHLPTWGCKKVTAFPLKATLREPGDVLVRLIWVITPQHY